MSNQKTINFTSREVTALISALSMAEFRYSKEIDLFQDQIELNQLPDPVLDSALKHSKQNLSICESLTHKFININQFTDGQQAAINTYNEDKKS